MKRILISTILFVLLILIKVLSDNRDKFINDNYIDPNLFNTPFVKKPFGQDKCKTNDKFRSRGAICESSFVPMTDAQLAKSDNLLKKH